jgi:hypothetical protein
MDTCTTTTIRFKINGLDPRHPIVIERNTLHSDLFLEPVMSHPIQRGFKIVQNNSITKALENER